MTRLQKKCLLASAGMHGLLLLILVASSAFRSKPPEQDIPILPFIPANILDVAGAGGGGAEPSAAQPVQQQATPPAPQPTPPAPQTHGAELLTHRPTPPPHHPEPQPEPKPEPKPEPQHETRREPSPNPERPSHEIKPTFDPVTPSNHKTKPTKPRPSDSELAEEAANAEKARAQRAVANALDNLARGVKNSGAAGTAVEMPGQGGGEAFAGYETVIFNVYYHAWITPDSVANKDAAADVKIIVARDGTILSAEIINKSGEPALDRSVERALERVKKLPPFPQGAHDEQRRFLLRFNLESKEGTG